MFTLPKNPATLKKKELTLFFRETCNFLSQIHQGEFYFYKHVAHSNFLVDIDSKMLIIQAL